MTTPPPHPTIDDMLALQILSSVALSPDGRLALAVAGKSYDEKDKKSPQTIMAVPTEGGTLQPYTTGTAVDEMPRWSPDGATLAFVSDRPHGLPDEARAATKQVYVLPREGGEARRLTAAGGEIHELAWAPDGSRLVLLMAEPQPQEERQRDEERGGARDVEERPLFWRLWSADPASGAVVPLTPPGLQVWDFGLAPDGQSAAMVVSDLPYEWSWYRARLVVAPLDGSQPRTIYTTPRQLAHPRISPDGATVAVTSCTWSDRGYYGGDVLLIPAAGGEARTLTVGMPVAVTWLEWEPEGRSLLCAGCEEGEVALWRLGADGDLRTLWRAQETIERGQPRFSRAGDTIAVLRQDTAHPLDLWIARLDGATLADWRQLTQANPQTAEWALGQTRTVSWTAPDGMRIQGLLSLPPGYHEGTRIPLVVHVHGGPAGLTTHAFHASANWVRLLAARGVAVLMPNPRGSTGWGTAFTEANLGDMGGADFHDIMAGVDAVIAQGIADPDLLGIAGWSYGGFMTAWAVTQTDRFKAAVMGAGIADWRSFHGVTNIPTWDAIFYGPSGEPADPYAVAGPYAHFSPLTYIDRVRTPTLILHGECDECVPVGQGYQFFRALRDRGVPVEMTVYPRAGHGPRERAHVRDVATRTAEWLCTYLT